jgi:carbonic anhydrase
VKYAGEIHFVHKNPRTSELAVLGFFMQSNQDKTLSEMKNQSNEITDTTNTTNNEWRKYFTAAVTLRAKNNSTVVSLNLASLMGSNLHDFWRYQGSLTTPPCTEGVIWTVFKTPILFNESKIIVFRKDLFLEGYRGPQPLYNRIVYRNFLNETLSLIPDDNCCPNSSNHFSNQIALIYFLLFWLNK